MRRNAVLVFEADGYRPARVPVWLRRSPDEQVVTLDPVILSRRSAADARLLFGGDVSLGRRYFDPDDGGPRDRVKLGRDIMGVGGMEDMDVDGEHGEASRWYYTGASSYLCYDDTHRGALAMCSRREGSDSTKSIMAFRNRIRVLGNPTDEPNKDPTLFGYTKKSNAGRVQIEMRHRAPLGPETFKATFPYDTSPATHGWQPFARDLKMPPDDPDHPKSRRQNARAVRFSIFHHPPPDGEAMLRLDDLAVVNWTRNEDQGGTASLGTPNAVEFVQIHGAKQTYEVTLTLERHIPSGARP